MRPGPAPQPDRPGPRTPVGGWRPIVVQAAGMWLATRVAFAVLTYVTVIFNGFGNTRIPPGFVAGQWDLGTLLGSWQRWDAGWFADIAQHGYASPESAAFFPLYPGLIHLGISITGSRYVIAVALVISNLAALVGFVGVALLTAREDEPAAAPAAVRALAAYPLAFFLAAPYSDALLLAAAAFTLLFARKGQWGWAALVAFVAALTRSAAVVLFLPLVWEYGRQHGWWQRERWRTFTSHQLFNLGGAAETIMVLGALPLGIGLYAAYLGTRFGRPLLFLQAHAHWSRQAEPPWLTLKRAVGLERLDPARPGRAAGAGRAHHRGHPRSAGVVHAVHGGTALPGPGRPEPGAARSAELGRTGAAGFHPGVPAGGQVDAPLAGA